MTVYNFRIAIHARPREDLPRETLQLDGHLYSTLQVQPDRHVVPLDVSFEEAERRLAELPRLFIEPDGSFVWVASDGQLPWQVDGCLYDRDHRLLYVEAAGCCPPNQFDQMLGACGWPETPLMVQLARHAVYLDESEARRYMLLTSPAD